MKKTQIIIITTALVLTLGCIGTFAALYFATDVFKSEQEMFYKYASQINLKEFSDLESYNAYSDKLKTTGNANKGEIFVKVAQGEQLISESIKYDGYSDPVNKIANYDISVNKDDEPLLEMNYLNKQDFYGILFKDIFNKHIVMENNNLKEFATKMGVQDTSQIPDRIEIPETNINDEEINKILNKYLNIAIETIPEDNYSKIEKQEISLGDEKVEADGYQVNLKVKDIQNMFIKVLENAKNDEQIYNLLNNELIEEQITFENYKTAIDELLAEVPEEIPSEQNINVITITAYKQGKNTVKLAVNIALEETENVEISIEKTLKGLMFKFAIINASLEDREEIKMTITKTANTQEQESLECYVSQITDGKETQLLAINVVRNGALTSNNIQFSTILTMTLEEMKVEIGVRNDTNFAGVPKEGDFVQDNHLVINSLAPEKIINIFSYLGNMLGEKLKDEMFVSLINTTMNVNSSVYDAATQAGQQYQNAIREQNQMLNESTSENLQVQAE